jgi:hypothetical protein
MNVRADWLLQFRDPGASGFSVFCAFARTSRESAFHAKTPGNEKQKAQSLKLHQYPLTPGLSGCSVIS